MSNFYYNVQFERDGPIASYSTLNEVYELLKMKGYIFVFRHNDQKTGNKYTKAAAEQLLSTSEQQRLPIYVLPSTSDEGTFVQSEAFWIENYMEDEFYNPDRMPHIEKMIAKNG